MIEMTIKRLESYHGKKKDIEAIERQIDDLRNTTVKAVQYDKVKSTKNHKNEFTEEQIFKIVELEEKLESKRMELIDECLEIEQWLSTVVDDELRAIIRNHYINGLDWNKTCNEVLGYYSYSTARKRVERYFENQENK